MEDVVAFARLVDALRPWLAQLVIVGGWAHRLHRFHPLASTMEYPPLRTRDADVALSIGTRLEGDLHAALKAAGFEEELSGDHTPPVTQYRLGDEDGGFYAEFLIQLQGRGTKRNGQPDATVSKAGITAQKLRHIDLLLMEPWSIDGSHVGAPLAGAVLLLVPNPVSFIVQKVLIHKYRNHDKRAQDLLYIHDTLELFGASLDQLHTLWRDRVRPTMPPRTTRTAVTTDKELFQEVTDTIRDAARIRPDRQLLPERIRAACEYGFGEVLGSVD